MPLEEHIYILHEVGNKRIDKVHIESCYSPGHSRSRCVLVLVIVSRTGYLHRNVKNYPVFILYSQKGTKATKNMLDGGTWLGGIQSSGGLTLINFHPGGGPV